MSKTSMPLETYSLGTLTSESSRSASSKSHQSEKEKEIDFTKDNSTSPIDLECYIQAERITKIFDEAIHKTKLAICLPNLVQEYRTLSTMLSNQHMEDLLFIFEQYENPLFSSSLLNVAAMEDIKNGDLSLRNRLNPELGHLMYIMGSYPALKPKIDEMVKEMKTNYDTVYPRVHSLALASISHCNAQLFTSSGVEYLETLERFRDLIVRQMSTTAAEELSAKIRMKKLQASNNSYIERINYYSKLLKEENATFESNIKQKKDTICKLEQELASLSHDASVKLKQKILDSDRQMVLASRSHTVKNEMLKDEEAECRQVYDNLLRNHMLDEKNQRLRRFKVETQLLSWLQKYDLEMGDKQQELDEFTEKYEDELRKCKELEAKIAEQDIEYLPLMEEREAEYHQEMTEKMNKFMLEHAARVIQCAWRDVIANRAEKKRLIKLKKKLLEDQKKAASKAKGKKKK